MEFDDDDYNQPRQTIPASNGHGPYQPTKVNLQNGEHHKYTNVSKNIYSINMFLRFYHVLTARIVENFHFVANF